MSQAALTHKYRPQRFADVAGQDTVKAILSRAAAENAIAPAYLFSGTRGVGKTTIARIFAKAINCLEGPAAEPCNKCVSCRQITGGQAVDVIEIDGASNRGIEDARRIKEDIGYAPMSSRFKVFIIDEAHMLTKEAFNALLKTLEEPPGNVTFILATTEPHKFPATIISRCQHFLFKRLTTRELQEHLVYLLDKENVQYEEAAVRLLVRRASGSVRDAMSLLGQVLALGRGSLVEEDVRQVLGLAGQEVFLQLLAAVRDEDTVALSQILRQILDQGLDLGFFLRELAQIWRDLFLLSQAKEAAKPVLEASDEEIDNLRQWADSFSLAHIHACWQMTLEGQRQVLTSLEPALALELLLLNLACLPRLLNIENLKARSPAPGSTGPQNPPRRPPSPGKPQGRPKETSAKPANAVAEKTAEYSVLSQAQPELQDRKPSEKQDASGMANPPDGPRSPEGFLEYWRSHVAANGNGVKLLEGLECSLKENTLTLCCAQQFRLGRLQEPQIKKPLQEAARRYFGEKTRLNFQLNGEPAKSVADLRKEFEQSQLFKDLSSELGAKILNFESLNGR